MEQNSNLTSLLHAQDLPQSANALLAAQGAQSTQNAQNTQNINTHADALPDLKLKAPNAIDALLAEGRSEPKLSHALRAKMAQLMSTELSEYTSKKSGPHAPNQPGVSAPLATYLSCFIGLKTDIVHELEGNLSKISSLNPSRREAVAQRLDRLSGSTTSMPLSKWLEGVKTPAQKAALRKYLEEIALTVLGQAVLLKSWSDRGIRSWTEIDLGRLNWALSSSLKTHLPLDRDGWQITRPNLYSWYNLSAPLQREVWLALEAWKLTEESPNLLFNLLSFGRQFGGDRDEAETQGYDPRFYQGVWEHLEAMGLLAPTTGPQARSRFAFTPTLRDGAALRSGPASLNWIGFESSPYLLLVSELVHLWWGPSAPPLWAPGQGLEAHTRDQLGFALGSPKPTLISKIAEMEACDFALLLEEKTVRSSTKQNDSQKFKELVESIPFFKKLKSAGTTLGDLQAVVSLGKLRPGGVFLWAREEPISEIDGAEIIATILERTKILCEWDFSELEHHLPAHLPVFPKYVYLFSREIKVDERMTHRPMRISVSGSIRSHVEIPAVLADAFKSLRSEVTPRGNWKINATRSTTSQRDWSERWPDPALSSTLRALEKLREASLPLANAATIRATPDGDPSRNGAWHIHPSLKGLWIEAVLNSGEAGDAGASRRLRAKALPRVGNEAHGSGLLILVPDESWTAALSFYLESETVRTWLEHNLERRGEKWILNEQVVKFIPVPLSLLQALGAPCSPNKDAANLPLPGEWERLAAQIPLDPKSVKTAFEKLSLEKGMSADTARIQAQVFVRVARAIEHIETSQRKLFSMVSEHGQICWKSILDILPKNELINLSFHPKLRISGSLPPHLPIGRIERVKTPATGILLCTESGFNLHLGSDSASLLEVIWAQLEGMNHPTWRELLQYVRLPRRLEFAESAAHDILRSHGEHTKLLKEMRELLNACLVC